MSNPLSNPKPSSGLACPERRNAKPANTVRSPKFNGGKELVIAIIGLFCGTTDTQRNVTTSLKLDV